MKSLKINIKTTVFNIFTVLNVVPYISHLYILIHAYIYKFTLISLQYKCEKNN